MFKRLYSTVVDAQNFVKEYYEKLKNTDTKIHLGVLVRMPYETQKAIC
jgi:hypothetical protein